MAVTGQTRGCFSRDAYQCQAFSSPDHSPDRALTSRAQEGKLTELPALVSPRRHAGKGPGVSAGQSTLTVSHSSGGRRTCTNSRPPVSSLQSCNSKMRVCLRHRKHAQQLPLLSLFSEMILDSSSPSLIQIGMTRKTKAMYPLQEKCYCYLDDVGACIPTDQLTFSSHYHKPEPHVSGQCQPHLCLRFRQRLVCHIRELSQTLSPYTSNSKRLMFLQRSEIICSSFHLNQVALKVVKLGVVVILGIYP